MITAEMSRAAPCWPGVSMVVQQSFTFCSIMTSNQIKTVSSFSLGGKKKVKEFSNVLRTGRPQKRGVKFQSQDW